MKKVIRRQYGKKAVLFEGNEDMALSKLNEFWKREAAKGAKIVFEMRSIVISPLGGDTFELFVK